MSVLLSLDGNLESESTIEIEPDDNFKTFLRKAKTTLGYDLDLSSITDNRNVSLTDNLLDFLIGKNLDKKPTENENDSKEVIYILNDNFDDIEITLLDSKNDEDQNPTYLLQNENVKVAPSKSENEKSSVYTLKKSYEQSEECHICRVSVKSECLKSYLYKNKTLNDIRQKKKNVKNIPEVICDSCLDSNYEKCNELSNILANDEVLVIKRKVQAVYRKRCNIKQEETNGTESNEILIKTNNESEDSESEAWIIQTSDSWPDNLPKLASTTPFYDVSNTKLTDNNTKEKLSSNEVTIPKIQSSQCPLCKKRYTSSERLKKHICSTALMMTKNVDGVCGKNSCLICGLNFNSKIRLQFHIRHFHSLGASGYLSCPQCPGCVFDTEDALFNHINFKHPKEKNHVCPLYGCGKSFQLRATLTNHMRSHTDERGYACKECGKQFLDKQTLNEHSVVHMKVKPFQCHICLAYLNRKSRLKSHLKTHESAPIFARVLVCKGCDLAFKDQSQAQEHFKAYGVCPDSFQDTEFDDEYTLDITCGSFIDHNLLPTKNLNHAMLENEMRSNLNEKYKDYVKIVYIDKVYRCEFCEKVYSVGDSLNLHRSYHEHTNNLYTCHICEASFPSYSQCTTHKNTHGIYSKEKSDDFPVIKHFLCEFCGKSFFHWRYLRVHRKEKHSGDPQYPCKICNEVFSTKWAIAHHNKKLHVKPDSAVPLEKSALENASPSHVCNICGISVRTKSLLLLHTKNVHRKKEDDAITSDKHRCKTCNKKLASALCLKVHMKTHKSPETVGKHHCKKCGKNFTLATGLKSHDRRVHKRETNYTCTFCDKNFYNSCDLKYHVRSHTGERPFSCSECGHAFRTKGMRNEHLRIHTKERPYPCDLCGLSFKRSYALKNHRIIHTGEKRFECPYVDCPQRFRLTRNLKSHIKQSHKQGAAPMIQSDENSSTFDMENVIHLTVDTENFLMDQTSSDHCIFPGMSQITLNSEIIDNSTECIMIENDGKILAELLDSGIFRPGETVLLQDNTQFIVSNGNEVIGEVVDNRENYVIQEGGSVTESVESSELHLEKLSDNYLGVEFVGDWQEVNREDYYVEEVQGDNTPAPSATDSGTFEDLFSAVENK